MPHDHAHDHDHDEHDRHGDELATLLELDAQLFARYWADALDSVQQAAPGAQRILDLGAGTGTGALGLALRFPDASVTAVDADEAMVRRIAAKATKEGLADRVSAVRADLDDGWPDVGTVDVTWASMSLHHFADPDRVLREIRAATSTGGVLALAEFDEPVRFLPSDVGVGAAGLEERYLEVRRRHHAHTLPDLGADWGPRLTAAGFTVLGDRTLQLRADPAHWPVAEAYARGWLDRMRAVDDEPDSEGVSADDRAAMAELLDRGGLHRLAADGRLEVRGERTVTLARA